MSELIQLLDSRYSGGKPKSSICAVLGDSRATAWAGNTTGSVLKYGGRSFGYWLEFLTKGAVKFPTSLNFGVAGDTSTMIYARAAAAIAATVAAGASLIVLYGCATNDSAAVGIASGSPDSNGNYPLGTSIGNLQAIIAMATQAGLLVIVVAEMPRGDTTYPSMAKTGADLQNFKNVEAWQAALANTRGVYVFRPWATLADASSVTNSLAAYSASGMTYDGLHQASPAVYAMALAALPLFQHIFEPRIVVPTGGSDVYSALNPKGCFNANPDLLLGTGGTLSASSSGRAAGTWYSGANPPQGYTLKLYDGSGSSVVAVGSYVVGSDGRRWYQLALSGSPSSTNESMVLYQDVTIGVNGTAVGNNTSSLMAAQVDAGQTGITGVDTFQLGNGVYYNQTGTPNLASELMTSLALDGVITSDSGIVPSGSTSIRCGHRAYFKPSTSVSATIRMGSVAHRNA